jgi:tetratricopeptide (TPR) repeat protein
VSRLRALLSWHRNDDTTKAVLATTMAIVTLLATGVAYLQQDASIRAGVAQREAERIGTTAMGDQVTELVHGTADFSVYRRWFEALEASNWAYDLNAEVAPSHYDDALLNALSRAENSVSDWAAKHTALLAAPYFDKTTYIADFAAYYAQTQTAPRTRAALEAEVQLGLDDQWGSRSSSYVTVLTLLAVSLFFFGLASTMRPRTRQLFAFTGAAFVLVALGWTATLALSPAVQVSPAAIDSVVSARTEQAKIVNATGSEALTAADVTHFEAALSAADAAVTAAPGYSAARLARAELALFYADALYFRAGDATRVSALLSQAQADFTTYLATADGDGSAWWNVGWAQMLAGDDSAALASTERAIAISPTHFALYLNRALIHLLAGDGPAATADTQRSIEVARDSGLSSNALFFSASEFNIERLAVIRPDLAPALTALGRTLREGQVSLQVLHEAMPAGNPGAIDGTYLVRLNLQPDGTFAPKVYEKQYEFKSGDSFAASGANGIRLFLTGPAIGDGTMVSVRVWHDGVLDPDSSSDGAWTPLVDKGVRYMTFDVLSPYGQAGSPLAAGTYHLEVYLDGHTRSQADWTVTAAK